MWIWEDGKQPRVNKRDGLAFVPFPRVYEKCRPTQLKDSVAYKPLSREKPRTSDAGDKRKRQTTGSSNQQTTRKKTVTTSAPAITSAKPSTSTSPKRLPPKNIQKVIRQSLNRKALGPQRIFKPITWKSKKGQPCKPRKN